MNFIVFLCHLPRKRQILWCAFRPYGLGLWPRITLPLPFLPRAVSKGRFFVTGTRALSHRVGRSVGPSVGLSRFAFFAYLGILRVEKLYLSMPLPKSLLPLPKSSLLLPNSLLSLPLLPLGFKKDFFPSPSTILPIFCP